MKYLLIIISFAVVSCETSKKARDNKAVNRVVSMDKFTAPQKTLMGVKCSAMFPVDAGVKETNEWTDSTLYREYASELERVIERRQSEWDKLVKELANKNISIDDLQTLHNAYVREVDSLKSVLAAVRAGIPAIERRIRETAIKENMAAQEAYRQALTDEKSKLAALLVENSGLLAMIEQKNKEITELKNQPTKEWRYFGIGASGMAGLLLLLFFVLKIRGILNFFP